MDTNRSKASKPKAGQPKAKDDENPTEGSDQNSKSTMKAIGGGENNYWNRRISLGLFAALPGINSDNATEAGRAILMGLLDINSTDPTEGMLSAQIIAAHEAGMHLRQLAWHPEQSLEAMTKFLELAEKAARTVGMLTERLDQHRGRGQQQITVKHVTVNADQALVADNITTGTPSQSSPARTPGNLLTTGGQKAMEILDGDLVAVGGKKEK
jgi:hypothetical protein